MRALGLRALPAVIFFVVSFALLAPTDISAHGPEASATHFPRPAALTPNVEFWKRMYIEFGVGDFVLHDRDNLAIIYTVVSVSGSSNEHRAAEAAKPLIQQLRARYEEMLTRLAQGLSPEELGPDAVALAQLWDCPCPSDLLLRAAARIRVQQGLREKVQEGMQRAQNLMPRILPILRRHNLPEELAALPMVESTFNPHARSKAGAVGLWQFIPSTGKRYMKITRRRDDRRDPIRATNAAAQLLRHNYQALGSWPLAIIAYNHGTEGILAARAAVGSSAIEEIIARYSGPRFGFASKNFYAEFLAALEVIGHLIREHEPPPGHPRPSERTLREG